MKKKILFIANHRIGRSPGQRFRFEQYLDFIEENNFEVHFSNIISEEDDVFLYQKGKYFKKANLARKTWGIRLKNLANANNYDIIFIFREALLTGSTYFEKKFAKSKAKIIFDFDDAIWLPNVSAGNKTLQFFKNPKKTDEILACSDMVFAGNQFLADYASQFCKNVKVIPTTIDTNYHIRKKQNNSDSICIGWTGTQTTLKYLYLLDNVFKELSLKYKNKIYFKVICDVPFELKGVEIKNEKWCKDTEIEQLEEIDIGIMPLLDDEWSQGKCGFKGLQYMAMNSVALLSPVGVNKEIIINDYNGFLVQTNEEWIEKLSLLIDNAELRARLGSYARKTIEEKYSVNAHKMRYINYFNELLK
ncbi:MAG: glycosyltransferase family 4 protein [Flavobacteriales bacterium]|nr:glycosyltransferase family 4 protein [Flavobacteriales bacterium]